MTITVAMTITIAIAISVSFSVSVSVGVGVGEGCRVHEDDKVQPHSADNGPNVRLLPRRGWQRRHPQRHVPREGPQADRRVDVDTDHVSR